MPQRSTASSRSPLLPLRTVGKMAGSGGKLPVRSRVTRNERRISALSEWMQSANARTVDTLQKALEAEGVIFLLENGGLTGVRLRRDPPANIRMRKRRGQVESTKRAIWLVS